MNENIAPSALRYMIREVSAGTGAMNSLANINTTDLPNGAACYVIADAAWWVLVKTSTQAAVTGLVLVPGSGPGRWFLQAAGIGQSPAVQVAGIGGGNAWAADANWGQSTGANFGVSAPAPPFWALTALGCILTYTGAPRTFLASFSASFEVGNADALRTVFAGVSLNNDLSGAGAAGIPQAIDCGVVAQALNVTANRLVSLVTGDTIRPKAAVAAAATSLASISSTLVLTPI